jgi:Flp pilus assembly protein TadD/TolB-like protein
VKRVLFLTLSLFVLVSARPAAAALKVIVLPLDNLSKSASLGWISDGVAISVSEQLRDADIQVIDREQRAPLVESLDLPPNAPLSRASMIRVAQEAGVDWLVMGSFSGTPDKLQITLRLLEMATMKLGGKISADGSLSTLAQMENEAAWNVWDGMRIVTPLSREEFRKRTRVVPNPAFAPYVRSLGAGDEEEQAKLLSSAVHEYQEFPDAQFRLGRYYFERGDCARTIQHLPMALQLQRLYAQSQFMLGTCYLREDDLDSSILAYGKMLGIQKSFEVLNNIAVAHLRKGEYPLAIQNLLDARELSPGNLTIDLNLVILRHLQGNDPAAGDVAEEAVRSHPGNGMVHYLHSMILEALGEKESAQLALEKAKSLGVDVEKLRSQDPKIWARIFAEWEPRR